MNPTEKLPKFATLPLVCKSRFAKANKTPPTHLGEKISHNKNNANETVSELGEIYQALGDKFFLLLLANPPAFLPPNNLVPRALASSPPSYSSLAEASLFFLSPAIIDHPFADSGETFLQRKESEGIFIALPFINPMRS